RFSRADAGGHPRSARLRGGSRAAGVDRRRMKLLLDQNLSFKLVRQLADLFPGASQVRLLGLAEADDRALWDYAGANGFTLLSQDADFAEMAALLGPPPQG